MTTLNPVADAYVQESLPDTNVDGTTLRTDGSPVIRSYLRFDLPDVPLADAILRIFANATNSIGFDACVVDDDTWGETTVTWNNGPTIGAILDSSGPTVAGTYYELDVSAHVTTSGLVSLALTSTSTTNNTYPSRTGATNKPELVYTPDTGGETYEDLAGVIAGGAGVAGALTRLRTVESQVAGTATGAAALSRLRALASLSAGGASMAGALSSERQLSGISSGSSIVTAELTLADDEDVFYRPELVEWPMHGQYGPLPGRRGLG